MPGRGILDFARPLLCVRDKIRNRLPGRFAADHKHGRIGRKQRNWSEFTQLVYRWSIEQRIHFRHHRNARKGHHQGIAVRFGDGLGLHPHCTAGAGLVDDDHGLLELFFQGRCKRARHQVGHPARRERNDDLNRPNGIGVGRDSMTRHQSNDAYERHRQHHRKHAH
jgi:hypothetical protein